MMQEGWEEGVGGVGHVGGLCSTAAAKGKSAVMNNVCKSEEGAEGGRELGREFKQRNWRGCRKLFTTFLPYSAISPDFFF